MSVFKVFFTGICGFAGSFQRVLMPASTNGGISSIDGTPIPGHYPYLRFLRDDLQPGYFPSDQFWVDHKWGRKNADKLRLNLPGSSSTLDTGVIFADGCEILLPQSDTPHQPNWNTTTANVPKNDTERNSLTWVSRIGELVSGSGAAKDQDVTGEPSSAVGCFVKVPAGIITSHVVSSKPFHGYNTKKQPVTPPGRALAGVVAVTMDVDTAQLVIRRRYGSTSVPQTRIITLKGSGNASFVIIGHASLEDILELPNVDPGYQQPDRHFELLYALSKYPPASDAVVVPFSEESGPPKELGAPKCVPTQFG